MELNKANVKILTKRIKGQPAHNSRTRFFRDRKEEKTHAYKMNKIDNFLAGDIDMTSSRLDDFS